MELGEFAKFGNPQPQESQLLLSELLEQLGSSVTVLSPGPSTSPVVGNTEFAEVTDELPDIPGTFLLMMSSNALSRDDIERLVEQAVRRSYSAIALKCRPGRRAEISAIAANAGIAVIDVADHVTWRYLDAFVSSILGENNMSGGASRQASLEPLFALANSLAEVFGGSVSIEGMGRQILAYSSVPGQLIDNLRTRGILSRRVPLTAFNDVQYREVLAAKGPLRFPEFGEDYARMAIAVRAGSVPLGTIWAIDGRAGDDTLPNETEKQTALAHAAWTAASHMLENWRIQDANQGPREEVLRRLIAGTNLTGTELAELGVADGEPVILTGFSVLGNTISPTTLTQMKTTIDRHYSAYRRESCAVVVERRVYVLIHTDKQEEARTIAERVLHVIDRVVDGATVAAVADPAHHSGSLTARRQEVDAVLRCYVRGSARRVLARGDVQSQLLINKVRDTIAAEPLVLNARLAALIDKERASGRGNLTETLLCWYRNLGNTLRTAGELGVHDNTVRYRIQRAAEALGADLGDPDTMLALWLQLRAAYEEQGARTGS